MKPPTHEQLKQLEKTMQRLIDWPDLEVYSRGSVTRAQLYALGKLAHTIRESRQNPRELEQGL